MEGIHRTCCLCCCCCTATFAALAQTDSSCKPERKCSELSRALFAVVLLMRPLARGTEIMQKDAAFCLPQYHCAACSICKMVPTSPPESLFCLALDRRQVQTLSPRPHGCLRRVIVNTMESTGGKKTGSQSYCCPDCTVLEQGHKRETPTPVLRKGGFASVD